MADAPAREHPIVNPEHCAAILRNVLTARDSDNQPAFVAALADARRLLGRRVAQNDVHAGEA